MACEDEVRLHVGVTVLRYAAARIRTHLGRSKHFESQEEGAQRHDARESVQVSMLVGGIQEAGNVT